MVKCGSKNGHDNDHDKCLSEIARLELRVLRLLFITPGFKFRCYWGIYFDDLAWVRGEPHMLYRTKIGSYCHMVFDVTVVPFWIPLMNE